MSPVQPWTDPAAEAASRQRANQAWDQILAIRRQSTQADAQAVSTMAANYPHMSPGLAVPLAQAGVAPDDPLAQHVATEAAKSNKKKKGFWGNVGDIVKGITWLPAKAGEAVVGDVLNPLGNAALTVAKPVVRDTLAVAAAPLEVGMGALRNVAAATGDIGAGIVSGAAAGAGVGGIFGGIGAVPGAIGGAVIGGIAGAGAQMKGVDIASEGFVNPLSQSALFQSFGDAGLGSGYMPGGTAHEKAAEAARKAASIDGHALTPGRFLATSIVEPGSSPYNLLSGLMDAAVTWELDPMAKAGKAAGRWRKAQQTFAATDKEIKAAANIGRGISDLEKVDAGLVNGARKTVIGEKVDQWMSSKKGQTAIQWLAEQTDFETIRKQLGGRKIDVETVMDLTNARTPDEVTAILKPKLGIDAGLELKPRVGSNGMKVKRWFGESRIGKSRLWSDLPSGRIDYSKPTEAVDQFNLLLHDANVPADEIGRRSSEFAQALLQDTFEGNRAADRIIYESLGGEGGKIAQSKVAGDFMRKAARRASANDMDTLQALINEDVTKTGVKATSIGGETHALAPAGYLTAHLDTGFDIDRTTLRNIRAVTSKYERLFNNPKLQLGVSAADHITNDLWKPMALLRGAWTVRVVGEEQIRMAASGNLSVFNHPISYLAWAMDDDSRIAQVLKKYAHLEAGGRGAVDVTGERFAVKGSTTVSAQDAMEAELRGIADDHRAGIGMRQQAEAWADGSFVKAKHEATYVNGQEGFDEALAEHLDKLHHDPVIQRLASQRTDEVRQWFTTGEGNEIRQNLVKRHGAPLRSNADVDRHLARARANLDEAIGRVEAQRPGMQSAVARGDYGGVRTVAPMATGSAGNPVLRDVIATGELNGVSIRNAKGQINPDFVEEVRKLEWKPEKAVGTAIMPPGSRYATARDNAVQWMFTNLMSRPSAKLSRSPMFRQSYWGEAENLITEVDRAGQLKILESAEAAKLDKAAIKRLRDRAAASTGDLTLHEADTLLKGRALDATQDLLYDAARKGQLSDVMRVVMPFMEAQKEVMKVWAQVGLDNPAVVRRAQQFLTAARGSGAFYKDPTTGEEMFTFPGSEFLTEKTLGMPIPLTGRVAGLNTFGSGIMPGVGPAVQIPARWMLPDKPQFDNLNKFLDPFGTSATEQQGIIEQQLPGWMTKIRTAWTAPESDRTFANTIKDVWAQGVSAGRYRTDTPEDIKDGLEHAKTQARWLYFIRGLSSVAGAPTPPSPEFMAMDKDGKWHVAKILAEDYRAMQKGEAANDKHEDYGQIGPDGATAAFVEKYGANAAAFMQGKSYSTTPSTPSTADFSNWVRGDQAAALQKKYGDVANLFGPQGEGFDYQQYLRNIRSGATVSLTPEQFAQQSNDRVAKMIFYNYKDRFGPTPSKEQRAWLSDLRTQLREKFPGFDVALPGKPDQETVKQQYIPAIERAVQDESLADSDIAQMARIYLAARAQAQASAEAAGYTSFAQAKAAAPLREWLRQIGEALGQRVPDFAVMYDRVFDREMVSDDVADAGEAAA